MKKAEAELQMQKHSEVRPQGGQVYNYKALQRVAGEPAVLNLQVGRELFSSIPIHILLDIIHYK